MCVFLCLIRVGSRGNRQVSPSLPAWQDHWLCCPTWLITGKAGHVAAGAKVGGVGAVPGWRPGGGSVSVQSSVLHPLGAWRPEAGRAGPCEDDSCSSCRPISQTPQVFRKGVGRAQSAACWPDGLLSSVSECGVCPTCELCSLHPLPHLDQIFLGLTSAPGGAPSLDVCCGPWRQRTEYRFSSFFGGSMTRFLCAVSMTRSVTFQHQCCFRLVDTIRNWRWSVPREML